MDDELRDAVGQIVSGIPAYTVRTLPAGSRVAVWAWTHLMNTPPEQRFAYPARCGVLRGEQALDVLTTDDADTTVVLPHWDYEYQHFPSHAVRTFAQKLADGFRSIHPSELVNANNNLINMVMEKQAKGQNMNSDFFFTINKKHRHLRQVRCLVYLTVCLIVSVPSAVWAQQRPDFSGVWMLDAEASGSMDAVFELQGISWIKRKFAAQLDVKQTLTQSDEKLELVFDNLLGTHHQRLYFDGKPHVTVNPGGREVTLSSRWVDNDQVLISTGPTTTEDGAAATITERRSLSANGTILTLHLKLFLDDGREAAARRVFQRQAPGL